MVNKNNSKISHSKGNMASYGFGKFVIEMMEMAFVSLGFFFYEYEVGLNVWLVALGYIIFAVWNAINDPLVGYLTNRPFKFTKKWGRRFPLILFGGFLTVISYFLVFMPPRVDPISGAWIIFGWLVFSTCLFDTFNSIFFVNYVSLFPDKFRTIEERRTATGIGTIVGIFGVALGAIIPPLLYTFGDLGSYMIQAGGIILVGIIGVFLLIPGSREDQETIDRFLDTHQDKTERESFFGTLKMVLKQKSFVVFIITYMLYRGMVISMTASIPFLIGFNENMRIQMIRIKGGSIRKVKIILPLETFGNVKTIIVSIKNIDKINEVLNLLMDFFFCIEYFPFLIEYRVKISQILK